MNQSVVRQAANAFKKGDYQLALELYEAATNLLGGNLFKANILICKNRLKKHVGQEQAKRDSEKNPDALLYQITKTPTWTKHNVIEGRTVKITAIVHVKNGSRKAALALIKFFDSAGKKLDSLKVAIPYSDVFKCNFSYLVGSGGEKKEIISVKIPTGVNCIEIGFALFEPGSQTEVFISDLELVPDFEKIIISPPKENKRIKKSSEFKVAFIADEFTYNSFKDEFIAIPLEPDTWRKQFEEMQPDIFFCESAWSGPDSIKRPWKGRIYASSNFTKENRKELLQILAYCRREGIPTVFWNKEDPTHHEDKIHDFVKTAKEFDYVFTTSAEDLPSYRKNHGVKNAFALPFATNPRLFNPIEANPRSSKIVFAGSWYANHVQRCKLMEGVLDELRAGGYELEIYDRYYGQTDPLHIWPDRFKPFLLPSKPHDRMPEVYKSSRFGLNFNTVTDSSTMFARRVFELMSSNTLVLSNYSRGTNEMFGDFIVYPDTQPDRLRQLSDSDIDNLREQALNKVLAEHTYRHRWLQILRDIGVPHIESGISFTVTSLVKNESDAVEAIAWFQQYGQTQAGSRLLLVASVDMPDLQVADLYRNFNRYAVTVTSTSHASRYAMGDRYQPVETSHFLALNLRNPPPAGWLGKVALHLQYISEVPVAPALNSAKRYSFGQYRTDASLVDSRDHFKRWLLETEAHRLSYFV